MKYATARAFRQALEDRLRRDYPWRQLPRLRKMIAFERFMARLDNNWILKGGYALQLRTERARTTQDIAEKLHAMLQPRAVENSRVKELIDVLLLAQMQTTIDATRLRAATVAVFDTRKHAVPTNLDRFPRSWVRRFRRVATEIDLAYEDLEEATEAVKLFIDPILSGTAVGTWDPESWQWHP